MIIWVWWGLVECGVPDVFGGEPDVDDCVADLFLGVFDGGSEGSFFGREGDVGGREESGVMVVAARMGGLEEGGFAGPD